MLKIYIKTIIDGNMIIEINKLGMVRKINK